MAPAVPLLRLTGLAEAQQSQLAHPPDAEGNNAPLMTPGRASARTQARAQLRAKARARRREEGALASARDDMAMGSSTARQVETVWEEEVDCAEDVCDTSRQAPTGPAAGGGGSGGDCWQQCSAHGDEEDSDVSDSSCDDEDDKMSAAALAATTCASLPTGYWEYPLSAAEKKARLLLLFGRSEVLGERQIRSGERLAEKLRAKVRLHRTDNERLLGEVERLRRERKDLCGEAANLRSDNRELKQKVRELQGQLQQGQQLPCEAPAQQQSARWKPPISSASSQAQPVVSALPPGPGAQEQNSVAAACGAVVLSTVPTACGALGAIGSVPSSRRSSWTSASETPRSLDLATPRPGATRVSMRGSIASVSWSAQASEIPWVVFANRSIGSERLYGDGRSPEQEVQARHLRRGEFITCISGSWVGTSSFDGQPPIARGLRILTSEHQEILIGEVSTPSDFCFEAEPEREVIGLIVQDGVISGVKQALLAPSRCSISGSMTAGAGGLQAADRLFPMHRPDAAGLPSQLESSQKVESRRKSLEVLKQGRARRIKEAVE